jgi:hypothetical protein
MTLDCITRSKFLRRFCETNKHALAFVDCVISNATPPRSPLIVCPCPAVFLAPLPTARSASK